MVGLAETMNEGVVRHDTRLVGRGTCWLALVFYES